MAAGAPRVTLVENDAELFGISALQRANLKADRTAADIAEQGFVTLVHSVETLRAMHALAPSVIAKAGEEVVGYALTMPVEARALVPSLEPMFEALARASWRGAPFTQQRYYVMGQICVARAFRGSGLFAALYAEHDTRYASRFDCMVTVVSPSNARSLRAHAKVGFEALVRYGDAGEEWVIVVRPFAAAR